MKKDAVKMIDVNGQITVINDRAFDKLNNLVADEDVDICDEYSGYWCTRAEGHTGVHVAHGVLHVVAVWKD